MNSTNLHESTNILEKELCYKVVGVVYDVSNKYGSGFKERIYQKALAEGFSASGIEFEQQKRIKIHSLDTGKSLGVYVPDFVIKDKIILEIKATPYTTSQDINQQRSYLKAATYEIAYLVNFGTPKIDIRRSIYTNDRKTFMSLIRDS